MTIRPAEEFHTLEPGLYADVPDEDYFALDAVSNSRLTALLKSPADCLRAQQGDTEMTDALRFGSAAHAAVLQPMVYAEKYRIFTGEKRTKEAKAEWQRMAGEVGERNIVREKEAAQIAAMAMAVRKHRAARAVLDLPGIQEVVMLWRHTDTGLLVKSKIDHYATDAGVLVDYKTTRDADPEKFERSLYNYGYYRQGAMYLLGMSALGHPLKDFVVVAQEKTEPEAVSCMRIVGDALVAGRTHVELLLAEYARRKDSGDWPEVEPEPRFFEMEGHDAQIVDIDLPNWAYSQIYDTELNEEEDE